MKRTILLLDDEKDNLVILENIIRGLPDAANIDSVSFTSAREALAWCCQREPDICLTDYMMPGMDGIDFITAVRKLPGFDNVPIIMLTGAPDATTRRNALASGATDFWIKPINPSEIKSRLAIFLDYIGPKTPHQRTQSLACG